MPFDVLAMLAFRFFQRLLTRRTLTHTHMHMHMHMRIHNAWIHTCLQVFDDAKIHLGFNLDPNRYRCVLIVDLMRPDWMAPGQAKGGMTAHLHAYIDRFREEVNRVKDPSETEPVKW